MKSSLPCRQLRKTQPSQHYKPTAFTAVQAAQKMICKLISSVSLFTAVQAAQKIAAANFMQTLPFTAVQAAQKAERLF